jgi:hypothetical protein
MTPAELLEQWRAEMVDIVRPYLFQDTEFYFWLNQAQRYFCRLTRGISDATSDVCRISISAGEPFSDVHPAVRQIRTIHLASTGRQIELINWSQAVSSTRTDYGVQVSGRLSPEPGPVYRAVIGSGQNKLRWINVPEADDEAELVVYRGPTGVVSEDTAEQPLEVEEDYAYTLLDWVKHLAYLKPDAETFDANKAEVHGAKFMALCAEIRRDQDRRDYTPTSMSYGGL